MKELHLLTKEEREISLKTAARIMRMPFQIVEKDYWVVWVLERLFSLRKLKPHLTFKGGTSLSKIYRAIDRFSEDIDLSIEKEMFGFGPPNDAEAASSKKKQRAVIENLAKACSQFAQTDLLLDLKEAIGEKMGASKGWQLFLDPEDPDQQTLLFEYPSDVSKTDYIRPLVKIEFGSRAEHWPVSEHPIQSYVKEALEEKIFEPEIRVRVLNAERTFWEKATILHQYAHFPEGKKLPTRISRHFYDFFRLLNSEIKEKALRDVSLLERVAAHKNLYFASAWASYETAKKETLKLSPQARLVAALENDYVSMRSMFFREIPDWNLILQTIREFEQEFNAPAISAH